MLVFSSWFLYKLCVSVYLKSGAMTESLEVEMSPVATSITVVVHKLICKFGMKLEPCVLGFECMLKHSNVHLRISV